jgi:hypothetical protein
VGHGYATEAARVLLRWAIDTVDLNRVQAETDARNVASAPGWRNSGSCVKDVAGRRPMSMRPSGFSPQPGNALPTRS